jgi:hypothetical protein
MDMTKFSVKNPVREHGASSMEKAIYLRGLIATGRRWSATGRRWSATGRRWSAPKPTWPFIPARKSGAFWLFHVMPQLFHRLTRRNPLCSVVSENVHKRICSFNMANAGPIGRNQIISSATSQGVVSGEFATGNGRASSTAPMMSNLFPAGANLTSAGEVILWGCVCNPMRLSRRVIVTHAMVATLKRPPPARRTNDVRWRSR